MVLPETPLEPPMVKTHYEHLVQRRLRWFVRMVVPADVRDIIGQTILMKTTGCRDQHQAALKAVPIIREFQQRIRVAREAGKRLEQITAEQLANDCVLVVVARANANLGRLRLEIRKSKSAVEAMLA